jgi:two-component system KDP operon response regulator KdpE
VVTATVFLVDDDLETVQEIQPVARTPTEFQLLSCMVRFVGQVQSHEQLVAGAWGPGYSGSGDMVKQHLHHLRRKLEVDPGQPGRIVTCWGKGYILQRIHDAKVVVHL